uniref:NTP_transf_2 domain-containing protein n=1 Tax=Meloidogyne hapla TaxID=6305 RepID=A0A1I8B421_MELHA
MEIYGENQINNDLAYFIPLDAIDEIIELIKNEINNSSIVPFKNEEWENVLNDKMWDKNYVLVKKTKNVKKDNKKKQGKKNNSVKLNDNESNINEGVNQKNEEEKSEKMENDQILELKTSENKEGSEESEISENSQNVKKSKKNLIKRLNQKRERKIINKSLALKESLESFTKKEKMMELYREFVKDPTKEKSKQLNIAVYIYEISTRFKWLEEIKKEWPLIYEAMFLLKGENKVLNKLKEKLINFKEKILSENLIENINEFEIYLHKLLKELIYVVEGIWDGRFNGNVDFKEIEIVREQLNYLIIVQALEEDGNEEYLSWEDIEREEKNKIVGILFNKEIIMEQNKIIKNVDNYLKDWKIIKNQRLIDNQDILNCDKAKYIQPEPFQQIYFDAKSENVTSEELEYLLETQIRNPELSEKCLDTIRSSITDWAKIINKEIKLLVGGSYMLGIDTIGSDIDLIIVLHENNDFAGIKKFFGTEKSICEGQKNIKCNDQSLYCLLCKVY